MERLRVCPSFLQIGSHVPPLHMYYVNVMMFVCLYIGTSLELLCLLTSKSGYHYYLMVDLFICLNSFHKQQHTDFSSSLESIQYDQYLLIREDVSDQKVHQIFLIYQDRSYVYNQYENYTG